MNFYVFLKLFNHFFKSFSDFSFWFEFFCYLLKMLGQVSSCCMLVTILKRNHEIED